MWHKNIQALGRQIKMSYVCAGMGVFYRAGINPCYSARTKAKNLSSFSRKG